jgi:hypothetical protein
MLATLLEANNNLSSGDRSMMMHAVPPCVGWSVRDAASPTARLPYLLGPGTPTWSSLLVYEIGQQGKLLGPVEVMDGSSIHHSSGEIDGRQILGGVVHHQHLKQLDDAHAANNNMMDHETDSTGVYGAGRSAPPRQQEQPQHQQQYDKLSSRDHQQVKAEAAATAAVQLPRLAYSHLAYVCFK